MIGESRWERWGRYALVLFALVVILLPVYWMVNMSFKDKAEFVARPPTIVVQQPTLDNYYDLLVTQKFYKYGINSLLVALGAAVLAVTVGTMAAYALSRYRLPGNLNHHLLFTALTVRMFPPVVTIIPIFALYSMNFFGHRMIDTRYGLAIIHGFVEIPLVIWMMIGFFREIPRDMEEAALVDGDSRFAVLRKIAIPLAAPGLAATFILVFISSWNEFLMALILTQSKARTLPIAVAGQITQYDIKFGNMMAAGVITTVPVMVLALLAQRHLTRGLALGGVTG
ncbi:MAG: carbohydrate ABC transporter permease [Chloroflexota bacterium]